ncbi:unnamed protein product [Ceutorhynchus assimilis]|uniref:C2HC/C3H-type domain-containing protein n=1 Tax=Ceutorhynchus assimilis TaxID=467358 RepID=A0A9N9MK64_9CUCU|nr:unnamed protein product [Ceutorhynchus assimilis]
MYRTQKFETFLLIFPKKKLLHFWIYQYYLIVPSALLRGWNFSWTLFSARRGLNFFLKMPKNTNLKLFTKTWPLKRDKKDEERKRPLTATLEKPSILDIKFLGKIDMSLVRKEFLNITNLCKLPLIIKKKADSCKPLRLLGSETHNKKTKKKRKKFEPNEDSHEDEESSVIQSAKINSRTTKSNRNSASNKSVINFKQNNILAVRNDANNNQKTSLKIPIRKPTLTTIATPNSDLVKSSLSTKLPSPCKTCGRPDLPERFHSHPTSKRSSSQAGTPMEVKKVENKIPTVTVKSSVQKPVAIKYQSKSAAKKSPIKKLLEPKPPIIQKKPDTINSPSSDKEATMSRKLVTTPSRGGSAKRTLTCYICGREFGTASLALHEPKCLQKWERENASLPTTQRRKPPVKPQGDFTQTEWNQLAWESSQANLVPCKNCSRTFYPDRLEVHQRSCKTTPSNPIIIKKSFSSNDALSASSSMTQSNSDLPSTSLKSPQFIDCYICGKKFGTKSIQIHEKQCLKKWHVENESLPRDMRSPAPTKLNQNSILLKEKTESAASDQEERPASGTKSPLFPCYLCGKLFTVNSIYIHEPQCLKKWKIENDKLPASKRRPVPLKPDVKFTHSGKVNFEETSEAYWKSHLNQLVPCKMCFRTFNPDRVDVHEKSCKGN